MKKKTTTPNHILRHERKLRGWTQRWLASLVGTSEDRISRWEAGAPVRQQFQQKLCEIFGKNAEELGFITSPFEPSGHPALSRGATGQDCLPFSTTTQSVLASIASSVPQDILKENFAQEQEMDQSRRKFFVELSMFGAGLVVSHSLSGQSEFPDPPSEISAASIEHLNLITHQLRALQRRGDISIAGGLKSHLVTIRGALETTSDNTLRTELWRALAQVQLLARLSPAKKHHQAHLKTLNEDAIASAQNSGDALLLAAALGHLGHYYLREERNLFKAFELLGSAQQLVSESVVLSGWCRMILASCAAHEGDEKRCEVLIGEAMEMASQMSASQHNGDIFFTDFSLTSAHLIAGNCWLTLGKPKNASGLLTEAKGKEVSRNRQHSAYYDLARISAATGELEATQYFAFRSIDSALSTQQGYILPRLVSLASSIEQQYPHHSSALAISQYATSAFMKERNALI